MDFKVKDRSNHQNNPKFGFLGLQSPKKEVLYNIVGQLMKKIIFEMADGGHIGFWALTELARTFERGMGAKFFI